MKCNIVQDLLPNYIDGLNSEDTNEEIKKHLDECTNCRKLYEAMSVSVTQQINSEDKDISFFKKVRKKIQEKNKIIVILICIIIFLGVCIFAKNYDIPLPFDQNRMSVELFQAAVVQGENGEVKWFDVNSKLVPEDCKDTIELVRIAYRGINRLSGNSRGRNIERNGEEVRVVYYCYYKTLWDSWFYDADLSEESESGSAYGTTIYGDGFQNINYKPQMREIYYLPIRNLHEIENLSDEEFDRLKESAYLIWKGVV